MKRPNQVTLIKKQHRYNVGLAILLVLLAVWIIYLFYQEVSHKKQQQLTISTEKSLHIQRGGDSLIFQQQDEHWLMTSPYQTTASTLVIEAFFQRLHSSCRRVDETALPRQLDFYATAKTTTAQYQIGEINTAADGVYVKTLSTDGQFKQLALCDKLLASMALAPAINFIDKQLYLGELSAIRGSFGSLDDFSGIDLSVLEVALADAKQAASAGISDLTFISNVGERHYRVLLAENNNKHLLLFEPKKSLIYVIAAHPKINAILGL